MSGMNPYSPTQWFDSAELGRRIRIRPIALLQQGFEFIKSDYWLFLGLSWVAVIIGSLVPFGILFGPMMVGLWLCFREREEGKPTSFDSLFRGFDSFGTSLVVVLIHIAIFAPVFVILGTPLVILFLMFFVGVESVEPSLSGIVVLLGLGYTFFFTVVSMIVQFAAMFSFQLIADKGLSAWDAFVGGFRLIYKNFFGVLYFLIIFAFLFIILASLCFIPLILAAPVFYASLFLLYREMCPRSQPNFVL